MEAITAMRVHKSSFTNNDDKHVLITKSISKDTEFSKTGYKAKL